MKTQSLFTVSILIVAVIVIGKVVAFGKDIVISGFFGAGTETDSFFIALNVTSILFTAFYSTVSLVFLPLYNERKIVIGSSGANLFSCSVINLYLLLTCLLMVFGIFYAPEIVGAIDSSNRPESVALTTSLARIMILSFVFTIFISFMTSIQISNGQYVAPHVAPIINNLIVVLAIIVFAPQYGIYVPAIAGVIAWMLQLPIHKAIVKKYFRYKFHLDLKDEGIKKMTLLFLPAFLGVFIDQANILVDTILATGLVEGSVSALNYSNRLVSFSSGIFVMAILTIMYPIFSKLIVSGEQDKLIKTIQSSMKYLVLVMLPITGIVFVYNYEVVSIVFQRGRFDEGATQVTSSVFLFYGIGLVFLGLRELFNKVFYAKKNAKIPLYIGSIAVTVNICLSIMLVRVMGVNGLALATSVSLILCVCMQVVVLNKSIGSGFYQGVAPFFGKAVFAGALELLAMFVYKENSNLESPIMTLITGAIIGVVCYVLALILLKNEEIIILRNKVKSIIVAMSR